MDTPRRSQLQHRMKQVRLLAISIGIMPQVVAFAFVLILAPISCGATKGSVGSGTGTAPKNSTVQGSSTVTTSPLLHTDAPFGQPDTHTVPTNERGKKQAKVPDAIRSSDTILPPKDQPTDVDKHGTAKKGTITKAMDFLNLYGSAITALATIVLVCLTGKYVKFTRGILEANQEDVSNTRKALRDAAKPCVMGIWLYREYGEPKNILAVRNIGQGAARLLKVKVSGLGETFSFERSALWPNEEFVLMFAEEVYDVNGEPQVTIETECLDRYNTLVKVRHTIPKDDGNFVCN